MMVGYNVNFWKSLSLRSRLLPVKGRVFWAPSPRPPRHARSKLRDHGERPF